MNEIKKMIRKLKLAKVSSHNIKEHKVGTGKPWQKLKIKQNGENLFILNSLELYGQLSEIYL